MKKVIVFIDGSNVYFAQKKSGFWLDWVKVKRFFEKQYKVLEYRYYVGLREDNHQIRKFLNKLKKIGFKTITKPVKTLIDEQNRYIEKANFDVEITADILIYLDKINIVILFSGDSDFVYLIDLIHKKDKEIYAFSSRKTLAWELKAKSDKYFLIERFLELTVLTN